MVINLLSMAGGFVAGFLLSFFVSFFAALTKTSLPPKAGPILGGFIGFVVGVLMFVVYVRWLFRSDLAGFRLELRKSSELTLAREAARE